MLNGGGVCGSESLVVSCWVLVSVVCRRVRCAAVGGLLIPLVLVFVGR